MSTEITILLAFSALFIMAVIVGGNGVPKSFSESAPKLGSRLEMYLETGSGFTNSPNSSIGWTTPPGKQK